MLTFQVIGPGRFGNYLVGYVRPGTREFMPLVDCNMLGQAEAAQIDLERQAVERNYACQPPPKDRRIIPGFYDED